MSIHSAGGASHYFAITPHASNLLEKVVDGIYIGVGGNLEVVNASGTTVVFVGVVAGTIVPIETHRVLAANTTATNLVGLVR